MAWGDISGRAITTPSAPRGFGVCDECGEWWNLRSLRKEVQYMGAKVQWTGRLVCYPRCWTKPQPQLKPIRLPADPVPLRNPRPEWFSFIDQPLGFQQYAMWNGGFPLPYGVELTDGNGNPILTDTGQPILLYIGSDGPALLSQLAQITGIPVPGTIIGYNSTIAAAGVSQQMIPAGAKSYIAIFNPCSSPIFVNVGAAASQVSPSISVGTGGCLFWATAQGGAVPTALEITVLGNWETVPFYAYASP